MSRSRRSRTSRADRTRRTAPSSETGRVARLRIDSIAAGGEGVGRLPDGRAVFIHRTAPGEVVEARIIDERPRWARAQLLEVIELSPDRRAAPCPHYLECGGCTLEHLTYEAQLEAKGRIVADALRRIGGITVDPPEVVPSPREHQYRNRVSFALRRLPGGRTVAGFHAVNDPGRVVPIDGSCLLPEPPIGRVWDGIRAAWGDGAALLPPGEQLRLTLRATSAGAVALLVQGGHAGGALDELMSAVEGLESVWHHPEQGSVTHVAGAPGLPETWGDEEFTVAGAAFLQVNRFAAPLLEAHVSELAGEVRGLRIVDAYCGVGIHGRRLASRGAEVVGIELDPDAVQAAADRVAVLSGSAAGGGATFHCGPVEDLLGPALPADLLILNPPRAGVSELVTHLIAGTPPERLIYVSCDPATLARDLKRLGERYVVTSLRCFDLFPQTAHVETVAMLSRRG